MNELQTLFNGLEADERTGMRLPTARFAEAFRAACPLDSQGLHLLAQCLEACSEQLYEHYRVLVDVFRDQIRTAQPDEETVRVGIALGILDDEEWEG